MTIFISLVKWESSSVRPKKEVGKGDQRRYELVPMVENTLIKSLAKDQTSSSRLPFKSVV